MSKFLIVLLSVLFLIASHNLVRAENLEIIGNGAGSQNSINVIGGSTTTNQQNNNTRYQNTIKAKADTGGNSASDNNGNAVIKTGDSTVVVNVNNQGNSNYSKTNGCCGTPTPKPTKTPTPNPTGTPTPGDGGGSSNGSGESGNNGVGGGGTTNNNPQIIGLSKTSGENNLQYAFYLGGLVCLGFAGKMFIRS